MVPILIRHHQEGRMYVATSQDGEDHNSGDLEHSEVFRGARVPSRGAPPSRFGWCDEKENIEC